MIGSEVQHGEYVLVVVYLWTLIGVNPMRPKMSMM